MAKYLIDLRFPVEGQFATPEEALGHLINGFQDAMKGTTFVVLGIKSIDRAVPQVDVEPPDASVAIGEDAAAAFGE